MHNQFKRKERKGAKAQRNKEKKSVNHYLGNDLRSLLHFTLLCVLAPLRSLR
jgi:hypothetical protein